MGKARRRRNEKEQAPAGGSVEEDVSLWINTAPRTAEGVREGAPASCILSWGPLEWYAPVEDVVVTARDLMTCAAYADLTGDMLRIGLEPGNVQVMLQSVLPKALGGRKPVQDGMLGMPSTIGVLPGGSSEKKAGIVMLKRGAQMSGSVTPDGARVMAQHWMEAAVAARHDELVGMTLADVWGVDVGPDGIDAVLSYMSSMRDLGGRDLAAFRREEAERMRLLLGLCEGD